MVALSDSLPVNKWPHLRFGPSTVVGQCRAQLPEIRPLSHWFPVYLGARECISCERGTQRRKRT